MNDEHGKNGKPDPGAPEPPEAWPETPVRTSPGVRPHVMERLRELGRRMDARKAAMAGPLATKLIQ